MNELSRILQEMGYEDIIIFSDYDYSSAFIGVFMMDEPFMTTS